MKDWFLVSLAVAILLAFVAPEVGASEGPLHLGVVATIGVALAFFLHGVALSPSALRSAAANWRLHILVQLTTFALFPALGLLIYFGLPEVFGPEARLGIFFLCALSSTISSSVALTALAKGNVPGAVFDASLSAILGMFLTPMLVGFVAATGAIEISIGPAIVSILLKLFLPFALGQAFRPLLLGFLTRHGRVVGHADRLAILIIVYTAFSDSVLAGMWVRHGPLIVLEIFGVVAALLFTVIAAMIGASRGLGFSREDEIAALFCGSQKSLANGAPIAKVIFGSSPLLGMIMLPLLLYHQLQLVVSSVLARRYAERAEAEAQVTVTTSADGATG